MFVKVNGTIEPDALAAAIADDILVRAAELVVLTFDHLEEDGLELNQVQKTGMMLEAFRAFDGTEAQVRAELDRAIEWANRDATARVGGDDA